MAILTGYDCLKVHFDKLILGGHKYYNSLEPIRTSYEKMFGKNLNEYEVYQTGFNVENNPLVGIITIAGDDEDIKEQYNGIMLSSGAPVFVHFIPNSYLKGFETIESAEKYTEMVYYAINQIVSMDRFYGKSDKDAAENPYIATVRSYPFYLTYHHVRYTGLTPKIREQYLKDIIDKYIISENEYIELLMESLNHSNYSTDPITIYSQMSSKGTIPLFL